MRKNILENILIHIVKKYPLIRTSIWIFGGEKLDNFSNKCNALISWFEDRRGKTLKLNDKGIDVVISALDKQTPKRLFGNQYNPIHFGDTVSGLCPVCMTEFICITPRYYRENGYGYCKECGQKIDLIESNYVNETGEIIGYADESGLQSAT